MPGHTVIGRGGAACRAALLASICLIASCSLVPGIVTLNDELPRETDVPGWERTGQYRTSSLKKIRQAGPSYAEYDPAELAVAEYCRVSDKGRTIRAELVKFHSPLDSFGLYGRERGFDQPGTFNGDDAYSREGSLFFRKGRHYLKITWQNLDEQDSGAPEQFRSVVANNLKNLPGDDHLPDQLFVFSGDRSTRDIIYYKNGIALVPGLKNVSVMRRAVGGKKQGVIFAKTASVYDAEQEFQKVMKAGGASFMLSKIGTHTAAVRIISASEYLVISHYKQWIFGVMDADTMDEGNNALIYLYGELKRWVDKKEKT